ncbi:maleylpyruvate isomerase N-terminal domain-containing protein [Cellulomonas cellasea]|uniref:maleylpyruvate isomerase N-terminal domain-containing protein n=1 Tax=Cellulomonas cellasea TaxID=43670 RepID=UPI0025A3387E|nr:maleylpyruvate isomerase N-terminal domain-containing protein [Cellulomonas cellasea]MDM8083516.1 maleylpyruvate isomerase N-terminal domain-containing protein [Cellulomonas cellasea]
MTSIPAPPSPELAAAAEALGAQWAALRPWMGAQVDAPTGAEPSILAGWTVAHLVAHVGRALNALTALEPAPAGTVPLALGEYVAGYGASAESIAQGTRDLAESMSGDLWGGVDSLAAEAFAHLDDLGRVDRVVVARRGPIRLGDMVTSRVIELVVHADDLQRSVDRVRTSPSGAELLERGAPGPGPIEPGALELVSQALLDVLVARGGWSLEVVDPLTWVRLAAGRIHYDVDTLSAALQAPYTSDAVPDLGRVLPLF